ncbi:TonB-linked outer membrane protein, SusC/RagA family [Parapedobacter composti]|uniref:TonB-linked outer membrane protein, SusC/RagA family n=1 Tax=Parapedobacter composti TaxID=623281 RepID=A0A1I1H7S7_9SPHI|nr:TonB-dependent receptor [Parapedobacter composti]SFC20014.1 TonB-linked outer membrane protein, SusC/RagA family [Parapedobacter composti]
MKKKIQYCCRNGLAILLSLCVQLAIGQQTAQQGEIAISGTVKDNLGTPLQGVSITNLRTETVTSTDERGQFSLTAAKGDSLVARYVGYEDYHFGVTDRLVFDIVLESSNVGIDEVVVVGFGQQRKISLVGAQSTVKVDELKQPVTNLSAALAGRIAGLVGVQRTGLPGQNDADLWIRGISTFNASNPAGPLIVVDGVMGRDINAFDPEDIESFSILKDAAATAVYGVDGANGVILITTKGGRIGKPQLSVNYNQGVSAFTKTPQLTDGITYMRLRNEAMMATGLAPYYSEEYIQNTASGIDPLLYPNVNWMEELFNDVSNFRRANVSVRGGSERARYYVSLAYVDDQSLLKTDGLQRYNSDTRFRRYNFTSNVNMDLTATTKFDVGVQGYITNTNYPGETPGNAFGQMMQINPVLYPVMYPGGFVPGISPNGDQRNPYADITQRGFQNIFGNQVYSNARVTQDLGFWVPGLSVQGLFAFDINNTQTINRARRRSTWFVDLNNPYNEDGTLNLLQTYQGTDNLGYSRSNGGRRSFYVQGSVNYNRTFGTEHYVTAALVYNQESEVDAFAGNLTSSIPYRMLGLAGRLNYTYANRYMAEVNFGYNGSENFAPEARFGFFPSFGVGWVVSSEPFFEGMRDAVQNLKIRYSNGLVGASGGGRRFGYLTIINEYGNNDGERFTFGNGTNNRRYNGLAVGDYGVDVTWAEAHKQNLGLEVTTLNSKLSLMVDFFKERREGVFLQREGLAGFVGLLNNPWGNLGVIENKGVDMTLESAPINIGATALTLRGTLTYNRDEVIENDQPAQPFRYLESRGFNYLSRFGYIAEGLFQSEAEIANSADQSSLGTVRVGDIKYKDLNGDGVIDAFDRTRIGNGDVPRYVYGFGFNLAWKRFNFGAFFQGVAEADRLLSGDGIIPFNNSTGADRSNLFAIAEDRWTPENPNPNAFYPRLAYGNSANRNNAVASTWWVKDISFLRLKNLDIGYYFPDNWFSKVGVSNSRLYLQGINLFYWSKFDLWDPELNTSNGTAYPNTRTITLGIQASF